MVEKYWKSFYSDYLEEITEKIDSYDAEIEKSAGTDRIRWEKVVPIYSGDIQTMPADMYLEGWYDMETGERFDEFEAIEKDTILKGKLKERKDTKDV